MLIFFEEKDVCMKKTLVILILIVMTLSVLGGCKKVDNKSITLVSREDGSGTRGAFVDLFKIEEEVKGHTYDRTYERAEITNSTSVMMTTIAGDANAIGYISLGVLNSTVKALKINGVEANEENIKSGKYNIVRQFNIVVKDDLSQVAKDFIDYIMSKEGQEIVSKERYVSIKIKEYDSKKPKGRISIAGSSSVAPLMEALVEEYKKVNENAVIELQQNDSTTGINSTIEGICDIGMSSRELKDKELRSGIKSIPIARDGIVVIINNSNKINSLDEDSVRKIFTGEIKSWNSVKQLEGRIN